jgi:hypothetical protein
MAGHARYGDPIRMVANQEYQKVLGFFAVLASLLCLDLLPGPYAVHYLFDVMQTEGAQCLYTGKMLLRQGPFGWDPSRWCGLPAGIAFSNPFSFQAVLLSFEPMWLHFTLEKLILLTMCGFGLYRMTREYVQVSPAAALTLTLPLMATLSAGQVVVLEAFAFPLIFMWTRDLAMGRGARTLRLAKCIAMVLLFTMTCVVFVIPYFIPLAVFLALLAPKTWDKRRQLLVTALVWTGYVLMAAPLVWGFLDFLPEVNRVATPLPPVNMRAAVGSMLFAIPGSFLTTNALPVLYCLPKAWADRRFRLLFLVVLGYLAILAFLSSPLYDMLLMGTVFHKAHLYRAGMTSPYVMLILSAYALRVSPRLNRFSWLITLLAVAMAARSHSEAKSIVTICLILAQYLCLLIFVTQQLRPGLKALLVLLACFFFLIVNLRQLEQTSDDAHDLYAKGFGNHQALQDITRERPPFRVASVDLDSSIAKSYGLETLDGKYELTYMRFNNYMREIARPQFSSEHAARDYFDNQMNLFITPPIKPKEQRLHTFNRGVPRVASDFDTGLLLVADVRYILSSKPIMGLEGFATLKTTDVGRGLPLAAGTRLDAAYHLPIYVYRLNSPLARAFFTEGITVLNTPEDVLRAMASAPYDQLRHTAYLSQTDIRDLKLAPLAQPHAAPAGQVALTSYGTDKISLRVEASRPGMLIVSNNWDKGWWATLNGAPVDLLRVDYAFQGIFISTPGVYDVTLRYHAPVTLGLYWAFLVGVLLILAAAFLPPAREPAPEPVPEGLDLPALPKGKAMLLLAAGTAIWCVGFAKFVWFKRPPDGQPYWYIIIFCPVVAVAVCTYLVRRYNGLRR